jgi:cyclin B
VAASVSVPASTADTVLGTLNDAQCVVEYADGIYDQLFRDEALFLPRANYMESQTDINGKMRAILIDWLIEVHMKYRMRSETLFLTINLIDRYLSAKHVMRKKLQLVGVVAMFIAAKFEEINPPELHDFVHITDNAYTKEDVLVMECNMLNTLNFLIVGPTVAHFFERLQQANSCDKQQREVAQYLIELGLLDTRMLCYTPSHLVSAALLLSNELLNKSSRWPQHMVQQSHLSEQVLRSCAEEYRELLSAAAGSQLQAVRKKFSLPEHHAVARIELHELNSNTHA